MYRRCLADRRRGHSQRVGSRERLRRRQYPYRRQSARAEGTPGLRLRKGRAQRRGFLAGYGGSPARSRERQDKDRPRHRRQRHSLPPPPARRRGRANRPLLPQSRHDFEPSRNALLVAQLLLATNQSFGHMPLKHHPGWAHPILGDFIVVPVCTDNGAQGDGRDEPRSRHTHGQRRQNPVGQPLVHCLQTQGINAAIGLCLLVEFAQIRRENCHGHPSPQE